MFFRRPSNDRSWALDQKILPEIIFRNDEVEIKNIRNFIYRTVEDYTPRFYDKSFRLEDIESAYYLLEPFRGDHIAHSLISFRFKNNHFLSVSIEVRKKDDEKFSEYKSFFPFYELMYVIADENDVIKLRTNYRLDRVYLYPLDLDKGEVGKLFVNMLKRAKSVQEKPEFFNSLYNSCTTNLIKHIGEISGIEVPFWRHELYLSGFSDQILHDFGLIKDSGDIEELRNKYKINDKALKHPDEKVFSLRIRGE